MNFKARKTTKVLSWTKHSIEKMRFYRLSKSRIKRLLRSPKRTEEGIAPGTIAIMQPAGSKKRPYEIWAMYQKTVRDRDFKIKIISCWRYPGKSPVGKEFFIPEELKPEIEKEIEKLKIRP